MTGRLRRLVFAGEAVVDLVMRVPALPPPGGDVLAEEAVTTVGGGWNVMLAAVRQGLEVVYAGGARTGAVGDLVRRTLASEGITLALEPDPEVDTGFCVVLVDPSGERTFVTRLGAESVRPAGVLAGIGVVPGDAVYVSGYGLAAPGQAGALSAWVAGLDPAVTVLVDPGPLVADVPADVLGPVLHRADWWSANRREATALTGSDDPSESCLALLERTGRQGVVVRDGAQGCVLARRGDPPAPGAPRVQVLTAPRVEVVDTTGAGDTHCGVFLAALAAGLEPGAAAERANRAAAWSVTRAGPATAPTAAELDAWDAPEAGR